MNYHVLLSVRTTSALIFVKSQDSPCLLKVFFSTRESSSQPRQSQVPGGNINVRSVSDSVHCTHLSVSRGPATEVERSMSMVAIFSSRPPPSINKRQSGPERRPRLASTEDSPGRSPRACWPHRRCPLSPGSALTT